MPLGPHERSVRWHKRLPYWNRPTFTTEVIGEKAAYEEADHERRQRLENMSPRDVNHQTVLPLMGGPMDGGTFRVPTWMLRGGDGAGKPPEIPIVIPGQDETIVLPNGVHRPRRRAVYRLDRTAPPTLRHVRNETI